MPYGDRKKKSPPDMGRAPNSVYAVLVPNWANEREKIVIRLFGI